jgi:uncharacterized protein
MQIEDSAPAGAHRITGYGAGHFVIDETRYDGSVVVTPARIITGWHPTAPHEIDAHALAVLDELDCELALLGTGSRHQFPDTALLAPYMGRGIGVEVMSSDAACRTYNILMAEGRRVVALLVALD